MWGYRTAIRQERGERKQMEICGAEGETPVREAEWSPVVSWVTPDTRNPGRICRDHPARLNTLERPIAHSTVRERWKEPRTGEWNRTWNQLPTSGQSPAGWWRAFCIMILRVALPGEAKSLRDGAEGKPSLKWRGVRLGRRETGWSTPDQGEGWVKPSGGPHW